MNINWSEYVSWNIHWEAQQLFGGAVPCVLPVATGLHAILFVLTQSLTCSAWQRHIEKQRKLRNRIKKVDFGSPAQPT
jgi:hypothetical protein